MPFHNMLFYNMWFNLTKTYVIARLVKPFKHKPIDLFLTYAI